jgi:hypothetical protein
MASNLYRLSFVHTQLKIGSANQRYPFLTSSDSSQQKFKKKQEHQWKQEQ